MKRLANESKKAPLYDELIDKAIEVFSTKGYAATNLTDITDELGVSRGPVYYHFKDKLGLYKAAYEKFERGLREIHNQVFAKDAPIMDLMEEMICRFVNHIARYEMNFFFMIDGIEEISEIAECYHKMNQDLYDDKIRMLKEAQIKGEISNDISPKEIVDYVYLVYFGILNGKTSTILCNYTETEVRQMTALLFKGIRNRCEC